jgi:ATP-dependent DNA helicase DinG
VFFVANTDIGGVARTATAYARGNLASVPALLNRCLPHDVVIHNHPSGVLKPSEADIGVASTLGNSSVGFYIVDNAVENIYAVVEPFKRPEPKGPALTHDDLAPLEPGGAVQNRLECYEHRPQQIEMARAVIDAFNKDELLVIEAGTGTGKSLAYLVPALLFAARTGERVVLSTNTINLQEQLIRKDIPLVKEALGLDVEVELVKGRGNYVCKRKADAVGGEVAQYTDAEEIQLTSDLLAWAKTSTDGSRSDLSYVPRPDIWEKIESQTDTCMGVRCHHYHDCFFNTARRRAAKARVLVANHHLLCADLAMRRESENYTSISLLPPYSRVVLDEAHHLEEVASSYFGHTATRAGLMRMLSQLHRGGNKKGGVLALALARLEASSAADVLKDWITNRAIVSKEIVRQEAEQLYTELFAILMRMGSQEGREDAPGERKLRLGRLVREDEAFQHLVPEATRVAALMRDASRQLAALGEALIDHGASKPGSVSDQGMMVRAYAGRLMSHADNLEVALKDQGPEWVAWLEGKPLKGGSYTLRLATCPVNVGGALTEALHKRFKTVVFTSATLAIEKDFGYFEKRVGLDRAEPERVRRHVISSPFDYPNQAVLAMVDDLPDPGDSAFAMRAADCVREAIQASGGRAFVLTTSFRLLDYLHARLADTLSRLGIRALKQGDAPRTKLMEQFCEDATSVLFGTDSFWEGVDARGDVLELVVITRLPFRVPTEPVVEARIEEIEARGGNAFGEYSVPQAVLKLKQGFGRLVRTREDRGVVLILDRRVVERSYGRRFVTALPPARRVRGPWHEISEELRHFFQQREAER